MRIVPKTPAQQIDFFQSHIDKWFENSAQIGLSEDEVADIDAKLLAARTAMSAQRMAQDKARSATQAFHTAADELAKAGSTAMMRIRAKAGSGHDPQVYSLASVPRPKKQSPVAAPGRPDAFAVRLLPGGLLRLSWKCRNPANAEGTMYELWRSVDDGKLEFIGTSGEKKFDDKTLPAGAKRAIYEVTAVRSTKRGSAALHMVSLGVTRGSIHPSIIPRAA